MLNPQNTSVHEPLVLELNTQCMNSDTQNLIPLINNKVISANTSASSPPPTFILSCNSVTDEQTRHTWTFNKYLILFNTKQN